MANSLNPSLGFDHTILRDLRVDGFPFCMINVCWSGENRKISSSTTSKSLHEGVEQEKKMIAAIIILFIVGTPILFMACVVESFQKMIMQARVRNEKARDRALSIHKRKRSLILRISVNGEMTTLVVVHKDDLLDGSQVNTWEEVIDLAEKKYDFSLCSDGVFEAVWNNTGYGSSITVVSKPTGDLMATIVSYDSVYGNYPYKLRVDYKCDWTQLLVFSASSLS